MIYNLFGDMDFLVTIEAKEHVANILVEEVVSRDVENNDVLEKEKYLEGSIKFDSCSHFWFGDEDRHLHLCGVEDFERHILLMQFIYKKSFELMGRPTLPDEEWTMEIKEVENK
ncbi:hypothetical protein [Bacillus atrophaeus]|uniref:hypothetical protein n=1 Tax=Bacillus atrophaeus TaxID=1452 RepID=UPI002E24FC14|nr:hypothetical protein [Bacillus atrophaeus]